MAIGFGPEERSKIVSWFVEQGVSTVLLCAILLFIGYGVVVLVPSHIELIQQGYEKNALSLEKSLERVVVSHERDRETFLQLLAGQQRKEH